MTTTAEEMRQAMEKKDLGFIELTDAEWNRMVTEIDGILNSFKNNTGSKETCAIYRLRSFNRDSPNEGRLWTDDGRDSRVENSLTSRGFTVEYIPCSGENCPVVSEYYCIKWDAT